MGVNSIEIKPISMLEFTWSENVLQNILTKDELREKIGLEPLSENITTNSTQIL